MSHFTYRATEASTDLMQGDILRRTSDLHKIIQKYHPHYTDTKFTFYMVGSQTCDLVRRKGQCKAEYISLCAVKPFSKVFEREAMLYQSPLLAAANAIPLKAKSKMLMFIERLCNNNHPEYFYLHEDVTSGLSERSCAFLRLSVAIKSCHYQECIDARIIGLNDNFQSKLGWLLGNLYSRVGTEDWVPTQKTDAEWRKFLNDVLEENVVIVDDKKAEAASKSLDPARFGGLSAEEIRKEINRVEVKNKKEEIISAVIDVLKSDPAIGDVEKFRKRLYNDQALTSLVR